jgi:hypothetical protein
MASFELYNKENIQEMNDILNDSEKKKTFDKGLLQGIIIGASIAACLIYFSLLMLAAIFAVARM